MDRNGIVNVQVQNAAKNLQAAIMNVRKMRQNNVKIVKNERDILYLNQEYLEPSDDDNDHGDSISIGSTVSDNNDTFGNQRSPSNSPKSKVELPVFQTTLMPDDIPSYENIHLQTMFQHINANMEDLASWKGKLVDFVYTLIKRIDNTVESITNERSEIVQMEGIDVGTIDILLHSWETRLHSWSCQWREHVAQETWEIQRFHQDSLQEILYHASNRDQMQNEDFLAQSLRWHDLLNEMEHLKASQKDEIQKTNRYEMEIADWQSQYVAMEERARHAESLAALQEHENSILRLHLTSIGTRLDEALQQGIIQQEIAKHIQTKQFNEMKEIENLNFKLLNKLIQQEEKLKLKEIKIKKKIDYERQLLIQDQILFEKNKNEILQELNEIFNYFSTIYPNKKKEIFFE